MVFLFAAAIPKGIFSGCGKTGKSALLQYMSKINRKKIEFDGRTKEISKYGDLRKKMLAYEDHYFDDMTFHRKSLLNKIAKTIYSAEPAQNGSREEEAIEDSWTVEFTLSHWIIAYANRRYKLGDDVAGRCIPEKRLIIIRKQKEIKEEDNTVLHEMIHAYEL